MKFLRDDFGKYNDALFTDDELGKIKAFFTADMPNVADYFNEADAEADVKRCAEFNNSLANAETIENIADCLNEYSDLQDDNHFYIKEV